MNPIIELYHILDKIFSYLSIDDLLTASLVSNEWFDAIASSSACMKRIVLSYGVKFPEYPNQIRRPYHFFEFIDLEATDKVLNLLKKCICVKSIRLFNKFSSIYQLVELLNVRANEVEELNIQEIFIEDNENHIKTQLMFPKLKNLQLRYVDIYIECLLQVFGNVKSLSSLSIYLHDDLSIGAIRTLWKFIEANTSLINLTFISNNCGQLFTEINKCDAINLKSLEIREISMMDANEQLNLLNFLSGQKSSLEALHMGEICSTDIFKLIIEDMPMLKELIIRNNCNEMQNVCVKENYSIRKLNLRDFALIKTLTQICRAIKCLKICSLTDEVFLDIADALPFLEELILESLDLRIIAEGKFLGLKKISFKIYSEKVLCFPLSVNDHFHRLVAKEIGKCIKNNTYYPLTFKKR